MMAAPLKHVNGKVAIRGYLTGIKQPFQSRSDSSNHLIGSSALSRSFHSDCAVRGHFSRRDLPCFRLSTREDVGCNATVIPDSQIGRASAARRVQTDECDRRARRTRPRGRRSTALATRDYLGNISCTCSRTCQFGA
jgi:hypothetical protein